MVWVLELEGDISTNEKFVLLGIANHAQPSGEGAFPSLETLCRYTRLSKSTVQRCVKKLTDRGLLATSPGNGRKSTSYTLKMDIAPVVKLALVADNNENDTPDNENEGSHSDHPQVDEDESRVVTVTPQGGQALTTQGGQALTTQGGQALTTEPSYSRNETVLEPKRPERQRKRDAVWDALMEACGVNAATINSNERGRYNRAVKLLKESKATGDEIHARAKMYRRKFPNAAMTPMALANHWSELDPATMPVEETTTTPKGWDAIKQAREERHGDRHALHRRDVHEERP